MTRTFALTLMLLGQAGITWGSDAEKEWDETVLKAARLISIAGGEII